MKTQYYNWKKLINYYQLSQTDSSKSDYIFNQFEFDYNLFSDYNDHVYYSSQLIISLQTFYQDWSSQEYSHYWENKIMQLTLNQSVQIIFKSVFKFASESVSESVYELIYESASEFVIKFVE